MYIIVDIISTHKYFIKLLCSVVQCEWWLDVWKIINVATFNVHEKNLNILSEQTQKTD